MQRIFVDHSAHMKRIFQICTGIVCLLLSTHLEAQKLKAIQQIEGIPPRVEYRAITHDPQGNIFVATSVDVFMIPSNGYQAQPMNLGENVMDVDWSGDYGLIMLMREGVVRFIATGKELVLDAGGNATCMDVTRNLIWVGTDNGVFTVSIAKEEIVDHFTSADGIMESDRINFIHTDTYGVRWIGTNAGVVRVEGKKWKLYEKEQAVTAVTSTDEGAWMAADNMMWLVNSYNRWFPIDAWKDLVTGNVKALASDGDGMLYIASEKLVKYDPYQEEILSMSETSIDEQMIILDQGPGKNVWMAGHNGMSKIMVDTQAVVLPPVKDNQITAAIEIRSSPVCEGMSTGHMAVIAEGGTPPYTYKWSNNALNTDEATLLAPGLYQVTITDQNGKNTVVSGVIPAAAPITLKTKMDSRASDKLAADAKASVTITGGTAPFQYLWSNGETTQQATSLSVGTQSIRVIDGNGCISTMPIVIEAEKVLKTLDMSTLALGQTIRLEKLYFQADSSTIQPGSFGVLEEIYDFLIANDKVVIEIGGHTNSLPEDSYCDRLSTDRAKQIAEYLYNKGISQNRITYVGYGKRQPIASNQTIEGRRRNQRVEVKITSL